ncbi:MAG: hypothetical protein RLN70_11985, partial [Rhodospirillaceae bacterium]
MTTLGQASSEVSAPLNAPTGSIKATTPPSRRFFSLSSRLLVLTVVFVLIAEAAVFAPTMGRFRLDYLREKLGTAHLVVTAVEALPTPIDPALRDQLLDQGGMMCMTVRRPNMPERTLVSDMPARITAHYDLRADRFWHLIADAFVAMFRGDDAYIEVTDVSPTDPDVVVEVIL